MTAVTPIYQSFWGRMEVFPSPICPVLTQLLDVYLHLPRGLCMKGLKLFKIAA